MIPTDTIFALSSGALPSGVAVIRISGPATVQAVESLAGPVPAARHAALRKLRGRDGRSLDRGLILYFPAPASFTGEDCAEVHVHGGRATVAAILACLGGEEGLRQAEAGEFSRRAFHNGKLDLTAVEGLADLISAQTEMQRRLALEHAEGGIAVLCSAWAKRLTFARAMIEAELDFADEEDVPGSVSETIWFDMAELRSEIAVYLEQSRTGEIIRDGLKVVIVGPPNAGKSSLLNCLAGRDLAIVTEIPGTTRDILTVDLNLDGFAVRIFDTAGLREAAELIEEEGIRRAKAAVTQADLILCLRPANDASEVVLPQVDVPILQVRTKADLFAADSVDGELLISTVSGEGLDDLLAAIRRHLPDLASHVALALPSRERHRQGLAECLVALSEGADLGARRQLDLAAECLRRASASLGRITGQVDVESLLDVIFSEFCIGK